MNKIESRALAKQIFVVLARFDIIFIIYYYIIFILIPPFLTRMIRKIF